MGHSISKIYSKSSDYVVCKHCKTVNWHENSKCVNCDEDLEQHPTVSVSDYCKLEINFYIDNYNYPLCDIYKIKINC